MNRVLLSFLFAWFALGNVSAQSAPPTPVFKFAVSGDSRNCGDIVMPAIATNAAQFSPSFYWHLGDLRAIYRIDEDIAFSNANAGHGPSCELYERIAWDDFAANQIAAFGNTPFFLGIGNHETIPPKNEDAFARQFYDWLDQPTLHAQRIKDGEPAQPQPYFHWIQGGVDFIYLDNAQGFFSEAQLAWFRHRLDAARSDADVKSVVVGMHEALPDSLANSHSMGDGTGGPNARPSGEKVYKELVTFRDATQKQVYVLASHSHFFMEEIFNSPALTQGGAKPLSGWIVGTAGAVRYSLPPDAPATSKTDVYGYLLGTVTKGTIQFTFEQVQQGDVPPYASQRYPASEVSWCFDHNSQNKDGNGTQPTCPAPTASSHAH